VVVAEVLILRKQELLEVPAVEVLKILPQVQEIPHQQAQVKEIMEVDQPLDRVLEMVVAVVVQELLVKVALHLQP
jgi:hypothetical protein